MARPWTVQPGGWMDIYYCGFQANEEVQINLYAAWPESIHDYDHLRSWKVRMDANGRAQQSQAVPEDVPANEYLLVIPSTMEFFEDRMINITMKEFWVGKYTDFPVKEPGSETDNEQ